MENTLENKAKFFALYWGQNRRGWHENEKPSTSILSTYIRKAYIKSTCVFARPIASITDEEAVRVSEILTDSEGLAHPLNESQIAFHANRGRAHVLPSRQVRSDVADYLRSIGFAVPYMGLSVGKLVEYGWVKLTDKE